MGTDIEQLICDKLVDMMEGTRFQDIRITDFARFAGISRSTFYLHFNSFNEVLQEVEDSYFAGMPPEDETIEVIRSRQMVEVNSRFAHKVDYLERNKRTLRILLGPNGDPTFEGQLVERYMRLSRESWAEASDVGPERTELLAEYASAGQVQALKWWVSNEPGMDLIDLLLTMDRYCIALLNATDEA